MIDPERGQAKQPDQVAILAPYEKTRPGFELVRADLCEEELLGDDFRDAGDGYFEVCVWDIWHWASRRQPVSCRSRVAFRRRGRSSPRRAAREHGLEERVPAGIDIVSECQIEDASFTPRLGPRHGPLHAV